MKYYVSWNDGIWIVNPDNQDYDGPLSNIRDPEYCYHIETFSVEEAIEIAVVEKAIDEGRKKRKGAFL